MWKWGVAGRSPRPLPREVRNSRGMGVDRVRPRQTSLSRSVTTAAPGRNGPDGLAHPQLRESGFDQCFEAAVPRPFRMAVHPVQVFDCEAYRPNSGTRSLLKPAQANPRLRARPPLGRTQPPERGRTERRCRRRSSKHGSRRGTTSPWWVAPRRPRSRLRLGRQAGPGRCQLQRQQRERPAGHVPDCVRAHAAGRAGRGGPAKEPGAQGELRL